MALIQLPDLKRRRDKATCTTRFCNNRCSGKHCGTCRTRIWRLNNPEKYAYNNQKHRADERRIPWDITFEEWLKFAIETEYMAKKGITKNSLQVDRINDDPAKGYYGYRIDNVQVLELEHNIKKYVIKKWIDYDWRDHTAKSRRIPPSWIDESGEDYF